MCECLEYEDGEMHLCAMCADEWRAFQKKAQERPPVTLPDLDAARREAEEALALKASCTAMRCFTCEPRLLHAIDALLAATAPAPSSPPPPERDWRNRALDGELALRVLLHRQRNSKPLDLEKYAHLAMRSASVLRPDIQGDPDNQAPPPPASESLARFGAAMLAEWWNDGDPGDIDGGMAQDAAEACGLWHQVERHTDAVECEWCGNEGPCGELTEAGLAALSASGAGASR